MSSINWLSSAVKTTLGVGFATSGFGAMDVIGGLFGGFDVLGPLFVGSDVLGPLFGGSDALGLLFGGSDALAPLFGGSDVLGPLFAEGGVFGPLLEGSDVMTAVPLSFGLSNAPTISSCSPILGTPLTIV